jgi:hypothetical protein
MTDKRISEFIAENPEREIAYGDDDIRVVGLTGEINKWASLPAFVDARRPMPVRKTAAEHTSDNTSLALSQRGLETDTGREKVGPGAWNSLPYTGGVSTWDDIEGKPAIEVRAEVQTISAASTNLAASHDRKFLRFTHETATLTIQTDEDAEYPESLMAAGHAENAMTIVAAFGVTIDGENAAEVSIPAGGSFSLVRLAANAFALAGRGSGGGLDPEELDGAVAALLGDGGSDTAAAIPAALSAAGALTLVDEAPEGSEDWPLEAVYRYGGVLYAQSFPVVPFAQASAAEVYSGSSADVYVGPQTWVAMRENTDLGEQEGAYTPSFVGGVNFSLTMTDDMVMGHPTDMLDGEWYTVSVAADGDDWNFKFGSGVTVPSTFDNEAGATVVDGGWLRFNMMTRMVGAARVTEAFSFDTFGVAEAVPENSITRIAHGSGNGDTIAISGVEAGDLIVGVVMRTGSAARPVFDSGGGRTRIDDDTWFAGGDRSTIAFWKIAESTTPSFGAHTDGVRVMWQAYRYALGAPVNPIGDVAYLSGNAGGYLTSAYWTGLTLEGPAGKSHVFTYMGRTANEALGTRPGTATAFGEAGATVRYRGYYDGPVSSWPEEIVAQSVSGPSQCVSIEVRV